MGDGPVRDEITDEEARATVLALLGAAGVDPPPEEVDRLADLYPGLRRSLDRYHTIDVGDEVTAAVFRAAELAPGSDGATGDGAVR